MIYNGHFEPHFLYKSMYRSAADMDQERYRMYSDRLVTNPGDIEAIAEMVRLLHHYIFDRAGIHIKRTVDEPRLPLWFSEKPAAAEEMFRIIEQLPEEFCVKPYFHHVYLALQAQNYFVSGDWGGTLGCYARLLSYTADLEKFAADAHISYFDALEFRCKIINNCCTIQKLNDAPEQADFLRNQFHDNFDALYKEYEQRGNSPSWKTVYNERWLTINSNDCFYYHTMPGGRPYFRELTDTEEADPNTSYWWIYGSSSDFFHPAYIEILPTEEIMLMAHQPPGEMHMPREHFRMVKICPPYVSPVEEELPDPADIK